MTLPDSAFRPRRANRLFHPEEPPAVFPIQSVHIDWDRLIAKRPTVLETIDAMPVYLLKRKSWRCSTPRNIRPIG